MPCCERKMDGMSQSDCNRNCWILGAIAGVIVLLFKSGIGDMHWLSGAFIGFVTFVLLGGFLQWLLCAGQQEPFAPAAAVAPPAPAAPAKAASVPLSAATAASGSSAAPIVAGATPDTVAALAAAVPLTANTSAAAPTVSEKSEKPGKADKKAKKAEKAEKASKSDKSDKGEKAAKTGKKAKKAALADGPRGGKGDDLKLIKGVGPKVEAWLNDSGIWHFDQIAGWGPAEVAEYMERMGRMGARIESDEWVKQAQMLAQASQTGVVY